MEEPEEGYVYFYIPYYDLDSGEVYEEAYEVPREIAEYIAELQERLKESETVCNMIAESQKNTQILNQILVANSHQLKN